MNKEKIQTLLTEAMELAYNSYGKYYALTLPHKGEDTPEYHVWLNNEGSVLKKHILLLQEHLTQAIYDERIDSKR